MTTTALTVPTNCPRSMRIALALQQNPDPLPNIPTDIDAVLLPHLPDHGAQAAALAPAITPDRSTLQHPEISVDRTGPQQGNAAVITFAPPHGIDPATGQITTDGLISRVEGVLWPQLGLSATRASRFLYEWLKLRKFMLACKEANCRSTDPGQWRMASAVYLQLHDAIDAGIRSSRLAQAEDTLSGLANGEISEPVFGAIGDGMSGKIGERPIYSDKALTTQLSALNPKVYGKASGAGEGLQVTINLQMAELSGPVIEAEEIEIADSPDIES